MRTPVPLIALVLAVLALPAGCAAPQGPAPQTGDAAQPIAPPHLSEAGVLVSTQWLEDRLGHPELLVLHIGWEEGREDWIAGHIPGQVRVAFEDIVARDSHGIGFVLPEWATLQSAFAAAGVDDTRMIVLTGDRGGLMAARGFFSLEALGLAGRVALLDGGLEQWRDEGRPLSDQPAVPEPATLTIAPRPELVVDAAFVLAHLEDRSFQLVDARPVEEYRGEVAGDDVVTAGHIPGAASLPWMSTLRAEDRPLMRPVDEIRQLLREADVAEEATLIVYCRLGLMASFAYFVARLLDREVLAYDESFVDWTRREDHPIQRIIP